MFTPLTSLHLSAGLAPKDDQGFKRFLKKIWFTLYSRTHDILTTSAFEHVFMGEVRTWDSSSTNVTG